jgi:hypothetical protein
MNQLLTASRFEDQSDASEVPNGAGRAPAGASELVLSAPSGAVEHAVPDDAGAVSPETDSRFHSIARSLRPLAVAIRDLKPAPDNARRHSLDRDLPVLMESLQRFGQRKPIVAKRAYRGADNAVLAGNGTLEAARRLGWSHLAVAWFEGTDDEAREFAIVDNRSAELSRWDAGQLAALQADGVDLLALWHDDADLGALLGPNAPIPFFAAAEATHRLDQLTPVVCPHCGGEIRREDLR